jgi:hypothetical protein
MFSPQSVVFRLRTWKSAAARTVSAFLAFMNPCVASLSPRLIPARVRVFLCAIAAALVVQPAGAYSLIGKTWASGDVTMHMNLGVPVLPLTDGSLTWNAAALPALSMWNQHMARMQLRSVNSLGGASSGDRVNSVVFSNSVFGQSFGQGTLAVTYYIMQGSSLVEADVLFNTAMTFDSYRGPLRFGSNGYAIADIRRVFLHEMGHGIGFNHFEGTPAIMNAMVSNLDSLSNDDIAGANAMYGTPAAPPPPPPPPANGSGVRSDFNGDRSPDLVWQNSLTGERAIWLMNGTTMAGERWLPAVPTEWHIATTADFNSDGHTDLVWQNTHTGQRAVWLMNGSTMVGERWLPTVPTQWQITGAADMNSDGHPDLVWQNTATGQRAIWLMNGTTMTGERWLPTIPTQWQIAAVGDFNSDGHPDLVWQNTSTGQRAVWLMNGTTMVGERWLPTISTLWDITAAGDFNGDGHTDLVWQEKISGFRVIWVMNGTAPAGERWLPTIPVLWDIRNR